VGKKASVTVSAQFSKQLNELITRDLDLFLRQA
jgi:hypothetical protein